MKLRVRMFVCILGLLAVSVWSTSAFAQGSLAISSVPRTTAVSTGHTEIAGDILISFSDVGALGAGTATLTVDYGVPVTDGTAGFITICGTGPILGIGSPVLCGAGNGQYVLVNPATGVPGTFSIGGSNQNQLLIVLPSAAPATLLGGQTLTISGVKVSLAAFSGTKLTATLGVSAPTGFGAYSIGAGQNTTDVISSVAPAFTTVVATAATATPSGLAKAQLLTTTTVTNRDFNIDVPENFVDAFKVTNGTSGYLNDPGLLVTFTGLPAGVFLNLTGGSSAGNNTTCTNATGDPAQIYVNSSGALTAIPLANFATNTIISNANNTAVLTFTGINFNPTVLETIRIRGCVYTSGATAPLTSGSVTAAVTMYPNGSALSGTSQILPVSGNFPRFANSPVSTAVVDIINAETDMLISFAVRSGGFDTGIAVANTTADPFGGSASGGATPNDGTVILNFYPQGAGSSFQYTTTTGSPGVGLGTGGVLAAGKTWTVLLSELLTGISGAPASFSGYVFVRANFTNAHGAAYVTDFRSFTSASPFLVLPQTTQTARTGLGESLGK